MIYYDPSEGRSNSRLFERISQIGAPLIGLEHATGADLLVSCADGKLSDATRPPGSLLLKKHLASGMLVQRKSGSDLVNSIKHLHNILVRMRASECRLCWLLCCGIYEKNYADNSVIVDGKNTGWKWNSFQGALDSWQALGGQLHLEPTDKDGIDWLVQWDKKLPEYVKAMQQALLPKPEVPSVGAIDPQPQRVTLMTLPGCGDVLSLRIMQHIAEHYPGAPLAEALVWMAQPDEFGVEGVGKATKSQWRRWLGLNDNECLAIIRDDLSVLVHHAQASQ